MLERGEPVADIAGVNMPDQFLERALNAFENRGGELGIEHFHVSPIRKLSSQPAPQNFREYRCSRKPLSFAVALNCGIGSNSLNADVNALDRLQSVRALNSSYCGLK